MGGFKYTVNKKGRQWPETERNEEDWTGSQGPEWPVALKRSAWNYLDENEI